MIEKGNSDPLFSRGSAGLSHDLLELFSKRFAELSLSSQRMISLILLYLCFALHPVSSQAFRSPIRIQKNRVIFKKLVSFSEVNPEDKNSTSPVMFFTQKTDHFNPTDLRTWKQAFVVVDKFYKPGGPVIFELGGEGPMDDKISPRNLAYNLTKIHNGLLVSMEHRYYGQNRSIPVDKLTIDNLQYLTSRQALADYANFIKTNSLRIQGEPLPNNSRWITFGGSYSGALSAWMRYKYPELVFGAHASSAPVLAQIDFWKYGYAVDSGLPKIRGGSKLCADNWSKAITAFDNLVETSSNLSFVKHMFGVYDSLDIRDLSAVSTIFGGDVQYGPNAPSSWLGKVCNGKLFPSFTFTNASESQLLLDLAALVKEEFPNRIAIEENLDTRYISSSSNLVQNLWDWQYCNEFGFLQTGSKESPRAFYSRLLTTEYYEWGCNLMFGNYSKSIPYAQSINDEFHGLDIINEVSNVVFTNGDIDPWHWLGINPDTMAIENIPNNNTVIFIEEGFHCSDYFTPKDKSTSFAFDSYKKILNAWFFLLNK